MPYITHIGTATPPNQITQSKATEFYINACQLQDSDARKARVIYKASQIENRYSVLSDYGQTGASNNTFFPQNNQLEPFPSTQKRMKAYETFACGLGKKAVKNALPDDFNYQEITHLITFSCTGMYAPGLDIELVHALGLPQSVHRICINFMGCYAAFNALKTAKAFCEAQKNAKVLAVGVELCTLHFQKQFTEDQLIANAIFADGASAFLVENEPTAYKNLEIESLFCNLIPSGSNEMAWHIADFGFEMKLSSYVPQLLGENIQDILQEALAENHISFKNIQHFAIHPGGKRIIEQLEKVLNIKSPVAYQILKNYGNMSSVTILFVLAQMLKDAQSEENQQRVLAMAFGPGLTLEAGIFKFVIH